VADDLATLSPIQRFLAPRWRAVPAGIVSAVMLAAAYAGFSSNRLEWLAWIGLVPLFLATRDRAQHREVYPVVLVWSATYIVGAADYFYLQRLVSPAMLLLALVFVWAIIVSEIQLLARWFPRWQWILVPCLWTGALFLFSSLIPALLGLLPISLEIPLRLKSFAQDLFFSANGYGAAFLAVLANCLVTEGVRRLKRREWWIPVAVVFLALALFGVIWTRETDDWQVSPPEQQGMDVELLQELQQHIETRLPHVRSVLIVRHGYLVFEEYFQGARRNDYEHLWQVTNAFTSALTGIAQKEGYLDSLDQTLVDLLPEYVSTDTDPHVAQISLEDLLTMSSGFAIDAFAVWASSDDWIRDTMGLPVTTEPGLLFHYNNSAAHLLSAILTRATETTSLEYADRVLFRPLGISRRLWATDPQGNTVGAFHLSLRPQDTAKLGYLYLNRGVWRGRQIVPSDFVEASTHEQSEGGFPEVEGYGYLWWVTSVAGWPAFFAGGLGGQYLYVIPDLDLVIVIASSSDRAHVENRAIVGDYVVPSAVK
jgi:CubicO group peptidase (beta-lactamase class C family)